MLFQDRKIVDVEFDGVDHNDAPDYCDAFICSATWDDTGEELTTKELGDLNADTQLVYELLEESLY